MPRHSLPLRWTFAAGVLLALVAVGCAQHGIPAIDPTGEHIFTGGTTSLASHDFLGKHHKNQAAVAPAAAVVPVAQPPCNPPVAAVPVAVAPPIMAVPVVPVQPIVPMAPAACAPQSMTQQTVLPGRPPAAGPVCNDPPAPRGPELTITPARIVAPINSEVVMAAGICGPNGYYVTRQPLEWMLAQDGVGQIVAVGHESPHDVSFLLRNSPQKVATNYARAHTSTISQVLNRGTPSPADDVHLQKGQSWITVSSPTEGTSHVVVWAPKEHNWDRRKTTATIYWVDASWRFPPCITARGAAAQPLTTVVTRANGDPISGWIVRYEFAEGPPASFGRGQAAIDVRTDGAGRATADLLPVSLEPGITTIRVQVIRPASGRGDLPQMVVGQGTISVQWTTPGLAVRALGASTAAADGAIGYRVEVNNSGDLLTSGVRLSYTPPPGVEILNSTPPGQAFGQRWEWQIGDLPAGTTSAIELNCRAKIAGTLRSTFVATSTTGLKAEGSASTDVRMNALSVKMTGPETAEVGREAKFFIDVTNTGSTPINGITASDTFDPGLAHSEGQRSPLVRPLAAPLAPGQTERFALTFIVTQPGRQCHRLDVTAPGGHAAAARGCVTGIAPVVTPPQLSVRVTGPATARVDEPALYTVELRNTGSSPATTVVLSVNWGINLELREATEGHEDDLPRLTTRWRIAQIAGGETVTRRLSCRCLNPDEQGAIVRVTVSSQQTAAVTTQTTTVISGTTGGPLRSVPARPSGNSSGSTTSSTTGPRPPRRLDEAMMPAGNRRK